MTLAKTLKKNPGLIAPIGSMVIGAFAAGIGVMLFIESREDALFERLQQHQTEQIDILRDDLEKLKQPASLSPEEQLTLREKFNVRFLGYAETQALLGGMQLQPERSETLYRQIKAVQDSDELAAAIEDPINWAQKTPEH